MPFNVEIRRDGLNSSWGFRLKGGADVEGGTPLEIIKVSIGSGAEGQLHVGDRILSINGRDARKLNHVDAQNQIVGSGTSLHLGINRPSSGSVPWSNPVAVAAPPPRFSQPSYGSPGNYSEPDSSSSFNNRQSNMYHNQQQMQQQPGMMSHGYGEEQPPAVIHQMPSGYNASYPGPQSKTIDVGGVKKKVTTKQFNSPLNLYSDQAIAEAAFANPASGISAHGPGYVDSKRHLPTPKDPTMSRPQQSATFKLILESEMGQARNQAGVVGSEFNKPANSSRPSSSMSSMSQPDPVMLDSSINQSASFKRLMHNMAMGPATENPNGTEF